MAEHDSNNTKISLFRKKFSKLALPFENDQHEQHNLDGCEFTIFLLSSSSICLPKKLSLFVGKTNVFVNVSRAALHFWIVQGLVLIQILRSELISPLKNSLLKTFSFLFLILFSSFLFISPLFQVYLPDPFLMLFFFYTNLTMITMVVVRIRRNETKYC